MSMDKFDIPKDMKSTLVPEVMDLDSSFQFRCHKDIACYNKCCKQADVTLTPYDILRMRQNLGMSSSEFLKEYTVPFEMDAHGTPGVKMKTSDEGVCSMMNEEGCSIYADRPSACRYYGLGVLSKRDKDSSTDDVLYFKNREEVCQGWNEDKTQTVAEYRKDQGVEDYDGYNRDWMRLMLKKKSAGPAIGKPSELSMQLFFMASYDLDRFKRFIESEGFGKVYLLDQEEKDRILNDELELLKFGNRFMLHVLFGETSIPMEEGAAEKRYQERKEIIEMRHQAEVEAWRKKEEEKKREALKVDDERKD